MFPTNDAVKILERASANILLEQLPKSKPINDACIAIFAYQDEQVKNLIWEIKYYRNLKVTETVGQLLAEKILHSVKILNIDEEILQFYLVPIPLTNKRLCERGYNHTELIAKSTLKNLPSNFTLASDFLNKIRDTPKQNSIEDRADRFKNIVGAFSVPRTNPDIVRGKNILLIDDVVTTGATVGEAKRVLIGAGAKNVLAFVVGH